MQEIGGYLNYLTLITEANKDIVSKLMEAAKTLMRNNASLTTQLSDTMKINPEMAKKINFNAIHNPEYKQMLNKVKRKATFESNFDSKAYCWTHEYRVDKRHSSQIRNAPVADHQRQASRKILWEAVRIENDTGEWVWKILNW